jgi:[acyl-carrier-protein] S-malonyltransferase
MESMVNMGVTGVLELLPAGTLTGLANRAMKGVETFALKSPDDIPAALDFVERHGAPSTANIKVSADD